MSGCAVVCCGVLVRGWWCGGGGGGFGAVVERSRGEGRDDCRVSGRNARGCLSAEMVCVAALGGRNQLGRVQYVSRGRIPPGPGHGLPRQLFRAIRVRAERPGGSPRVAEVSSDSAPIPLNPRPLVHD